jgi:small-conductance mechanosensitive channel
MDLGIFKQAWDWLNQHPYILGAAMMLAAVILAKITDIVFTRCMKIVAKKTKSTLDDDIINQLHRPVQWSVVLAGAVFTLQMFIDDEHIADKASKAIYSMLIILWTMVGIRLSRTIFKALIRRKRGDTALISALPLLDNIVLVVLLAHGAFWLLDMWHVNVTPLLASAGIVTAAVALASKDTLANFFGGVSIFVDRPYRLGDYVNLDSGERGEVVNIGVRSTRILTRDDVLITVPNAVMANSKIINESGQVPRYRVRADVGVSYDADPEKVEEVLMSSLEDLHEILPSPKPRVRFRRFGDSALEFQLLAWVHDPGDRGRILHEINKNIYKKLGQAGIEIPFPQRVLHMASKEILAKAPEDDEGSDKQGS